MTVVFDVHQHHGFGLHGLLGRDDDSLDPEPGWLDTEVAQRRRQMAALGIDKALVLPVNSYARPDGIADTRRQNDAIATYCAADPERFPFGCGVVEPQYGRRAFDEIRRMRHDLGLVGIAYHCRFQGVPNDDPWVQRHVGLAGELGMLAVFHAVSESSLESLTLLERVAAAHPSVPLVVLDCFMSHIQTDVVIDLVFRRDNVWFDTSGAWNPLELRRFIGAHGPGRLLFGTNLYSAPTAFQTVNTPEVLRAQLGLDGASADSVLGGNLEALLASVPAARRVS